MKAVLILLLLASLSYGKPVKRPATLVQKTYHGQWLVLKGNRETLWKFLQYSDGTIEWIRLIDYPEKETLHHEGLTIKSLVP